MNFWLSLGLAWLAVSVVAGLLWGRFLRASRGISAEQAEEYERQSLAEEAEHWRREREKRNDQSK